MVALVNSKENFTIELKNKHEQVSNLINKAQDIANKIVRKDTLSSSSSSLALRKPIIAELDETLREMEKIVWDPNRVPEQANFVNQQKLPSYQPILPNLPENSLTEEFNAIIDEKLGQPGYKGYVQTMKTLCATAPQKWNPVFDGTSPEVDRSYQRAELGRKFAPIIDRIELIASERFAFPEVDRFVSLGTHLEAITREEMEKHTREEPGYRNFIETMHTVIALDPQKWNPLFTSNYRQIEQEQEEEFQKKQTADLRFEFNELRNLSSQFQQIEQEMIDNLKV